MAQAPLPMSFDQCLDYFCHRFEQRHRRYLVGEIEVKDGWELRQLHVVCEIPARGLTKRIINAAVDRFVDCLGPFPTALCNLPRANTAHYQGILAFRRVIARLFVDYYTGSDILVARFDILALVPPKSKDKSNA